MQRQALRAAGLAAGVLLVFSIPAHARGEWPDGPNKQWLESLERPDNGKHTERQLDPKSLSCCGAGDTVKTKFKVENTGGLSRRCLVCVAKRTRGSDSSGEDR